MLRRICWASCSLLLFSCAKITRPDMDLCVINAPGKKLTCYNFKNDFGDDGQILPSAKPHFKPAPTIESVNKHVAIDPDGFGKLKAYVKLLREEYEKGCK